MHEPAEAPSNSISTLQFKENKQPGKKKEYDLPSLPKLGSYKMRPAELQASHMHTSARTLTERGMCLERIEVRVERKIATARAESGKYFEKLEGFKKKSQALPQLVLNNQRVLSPSFSTESIKVQEVRSRRDKIQEIEHIERTQKYAMHHENRPGRLSIVRSFEDAKRRRFFLQIMFISNFSHFLLMREEASRTTIGNTFQYNVHQMLRIKKAKAVLAELQHRLGKNRNKTRKTRAQLNRTFLLFFVKWRLKRRVKASSLLLGFLKKIRFAKCHIKSIFLRIRRAVRIIQRNVRVLLLCKKARLLALQLKLKGYVEGLRQEAEAYKRNHPEWALTDENKLLHPKYNMDLNLPLEGDTHNGMLVIFMQMKKKEWIGQVDMLRKNTREQNTGCVTSTARQQFPFARFPLYQRTTHKDMLHLAQAIYQAKYSAFYVREKAVRKVLKRSGKDTSKRNTC